MGGVHAGHRAINSGVMPKEGLNYRNYFLEYSFDKFVTAQGDTIFEKGSGAGFEDVKVLEWVYERKILDANFAVVAGL